MTVKTLSRKAIKTITAEAHQVVYRTLGALFGDRHSFRQAACKRSAESGIFILNGYTNDLVDFVPLVDMVVGAKIYNKERLPQISPLSVSRLVRQTFVGKKAWITSDVYVETKAVVEPMAKLIAKYAEHFDVFAGVYQNKYTYSNVFGLVVLLKGVEGAERLSWELTIDDIDLQPMDSLKAIFR